MNENTVSLVFSKEDIPLLGEALGALPFNRVSSLISRLNAQLAEQQKREIESADEAKED